jgi:hypothetical protein
MKIVRALYLAVGFALAGCSYQLQLQQRGGPATGSGTAQDDGSSVQITIGSRVFTGQYAYASDASFGSFVGIGKGATSGFVSTSSGGGGNIIARSADGVGLRCRFQYSEMSNQGFGECQDDTGAAYDLQIRMGAVR